MTGRTLDWAAQTVAEEEVLAAFAAYCRDEGLPPDGQGALLELQSGVEVFLLRIKNRQGSQAARDIGMIGPDRVLPDFERPAQNGLGFGVMALARIEIGEVRQDFGDLGVPRSKFFLPQAERAKA